MNQINPAKLLFSKWTAIRPVNREKHFEIVRIYFDKTGKVTDCLIEAVLTKHAYAIDWRELKDSDKWKMGWH